MRAIEEAIDGNAQALEPQPAVIDAVEPVLVAGVAGAHARHGRAIVLADTDEYGVNALAGASHVELREYHGPARVVRGAADPLLARGLAGRVDLELARLVDVRRRGLDRGHVGAVTDLAHREASELLARGDLREPRVMSLGPERPDRATVETELHADLDEQREVAVRELLEHRREHREVAGRRDLGKREATEPGGREVREPAAYERPVLGDR